ncbi:MAG: response regulator transcription factor [Bacteroidetes bacterium]|nr:response regulator transcription factor [Bacteroidota bacterium]
MTPIKILIANKNEAKRGDLINLFQDVDDISVIGEAANARETIQESVLLFPEVVILDSSISGGSDNETMRVLKNAFPYIKVLTYSTQENKQQSTFNKFHPADGHLMSSMSDDQIAEAIRRIFWDQPTVSDKPSFEGQFTVIR